MQWYRKFGYHDFDVIFFFFCVLEFCCCVGFVFMTIQCLCVYCVNLTLLFLLPILLLLLLILLLMLDIMAAHPYCSHNKASSRTPNSKHLKETDLFFILSLLFYYLLLIKYINCLPRDYSLSLFL